MPTVEPGSEQGKQADGAGAQGEQGAQQQALQLKPLLWADQAVVNAYTEALKNGLAAASDANGVLITGSLAIATLYGTLIGLVSPKTQVAPIIVVLPMGALVGAFLAAIIGKTRGISFAPITTVEQVRIGITGAINKQRLGTTVAVILLVIGLISGGFMLAYVYGGPKPAPTTITVYLTAAGQTAISSACGERVSSITGTAESSPIGSEDIVVIPTPHSACGGQRLELTQKEVAAIK